MRARSIPAIEDNLLERRLSDVMAGRGLLVSECNESIMLPERFKARRLLKIERDSGTAERRLLDRSREVSEPARGNNAVVEIEVRPLSDNDKCRRNLHFVGGRTTGVGGMTVEAAEEWLLPDPDLRMRWEVGRGLLDLEGELLLGR